MELIDKDMSKIEEMAIKDLPVVITGNGWNDLDENEVLRKGYILGANAVLNEILRYIGNHSSFESDILKDKLKELKGEQL
jgi:hypothetical protein